MPDEISRAEYETRHAEQRQEILKVETALRSDIKSLEVKIDNLSQAISNLTAANSAAFWKLIATSLVTFLTGGGIGVYVTFLFTHH